MPLASVGSVVTKIDRWAAGEGGDSTSAKIGRQLASGEWVTPQWLAETFPPQPQAEDEDEHQRQAEITDHQHKIRQLMTVVVTDFKRAGWHVETRKVRFSNGRKSYRARPPSGRRHLPAEAPAPAEVMDRRSRPTVLANGSHPALGAQLQVKILALTDDGLVMHLSDGTGGAWQCLITGHLTGAP
jgi:hypothetical protein